MPLASALSIHSPARLLDARAAERTAPSAPAERAYEPDTEEQLFEPRSALGELLHVLAFIHPVERG